MSKTTRNSLLLFGIVLSLALLSLRVWSIFNAPSSDMSMFAESLGYEHPRNYAVFLLDGEKEPLLFMFTIRKGAVDFISVASGERVLKNLYKPSLAEAVGILVERINASETPSAVDAVGFMTIDAAGRLADTFGGFYIDDEKLDSNNFGEAMRKLAGTEHTAKELADSVHISKYKMVTRSANVLKVLKDVFGKRMVAVYFSDSTEFGKSCFGACGTQLFEYFPPSANLDR